MKLYNKFANALTPLAKGLGSEYCNQNAYDCIQIHGGSGFMKDYACERVYRDARITSIYEGTTQLQVVAAIGNVTTGMYNSIIATYQEMPVSEELQPLKAEVEKMLETYNKSVALINEINDPEYTSFHARRLVEMAGDIIMSYLLITDASRYESESMAKSAHVYVNMAKAEVAKNSEFIASFSPSQIECYK